MLSVEIRLPDAVNWSRRIACVSSSPYRGSLINQLHALNKHFQIAVVILPREVLFALGRPTSKLPLFTGVNHFMCPSFLRERRDEQSRHLAQGNWARLSQKKPGMESFEFVCFHWKRDQAMACRELSARKKDWFDSHKKGFIVSIL